MDKNRVGQHISAEFNNELADIASRVLLMGGMVEQQIRDALEALVEGNQKLGAVVVSNDHRVNALEVAIDEECMQVIARRQPAAGDLRLVVTAIKVITDLERIGDEAEGIGHVALTYVPPGPGANMELRTMGRHVSQMVRNALDAFARTDVELALQVARDEEMVDQEYDSLVRQLITYMMEDPRTISGTIQLLWAARALERIADHARNIAEYIVFLVRGRDVRHLTVDQMEKAARDVRR